MPEPMKFLVHWDNIDRKVKDIVHRFEAKKPGLIIGLGRGGFIPAVMLSHRLGVPMQAIMWQTRDGSFRNLAGIALALNRHDEEHVLVVDDINDTGRALIDFTKLLEEHIYRTSSGVTYETAVLYERNTSAFKADYVVETLTDERWITFPWEE